MDDFNEYNFEKFVSGVCDVIYGLSDMNIGGKTLANQIGLDVQGQINRYYNYLNELYEIAIAHNLTDIISKYPLLEEIHEELEYANEQRVHSNLIDEIEPGDLVQLRDGRRLYVADPYYGTDTMWVTDDKSNRDSADAFGWVAYHSDIVDIIDKYNA